MKFNSEIQVRVGAVKALLNNAGIDDLIIYCRESFDQLGQHYSGDAKLLDKDEFSIDKSRLDDYLKNLKVKRIITFGNGQVTDMGKYLASKLDVVLISIPTILSTNVYFTDKSCLLVNSRKKTLVTKIPDVVVLDNQLLSKAKFCYHKLGLADIVSILTANEDWHIARNVVGEEVDVFSEQLALSLVQILEKNLNKIAVGSSDSNILISNLLMVSGYLTNIYGSGRPESGSEHIFSKSLELRLNVYHGVAVCLGSLIMSKLQGKGYKRILRIIKKLKIFEEVNIDGLTRGAVADAVMDMDDEPSRFTIINMIDFSRQEIDEVVDQIFNDLGL